MNLLIKRNKIHYEYNLLLLLSVVIISFLIYMFIQNNKYITIAPQNISVLTSQEKAITITLENYKVQKKQILKKVSIKKKKIQKKEIIKKVIKQVIQKREVIAKVEKQVIKQEIVKEVIQKVSTQQKVEKKVQTPIFNAKEKEIFISGLYSIINNNKKYPKMAKRRKLEGISTVSFTLKKNGTIDNIFLCDSCGHRILDKASIKLINSIKAYKCIPDTVSLTALNLNIPIKYSRN